MNEEELVKKYYYDPTTGFVGINKLHKKIIKEIPNITKEKIKEILDKQEIYQISKKNNQKLNSFIPTFPLQEIQVDLIYIEDKHLNKARYALTAIDIFTKKGHIELLKKKDEENIIAATEKILKILGIPEMVYCDEGSEFTSTAFRNLMKKNNIKLITNIAHATFVERFNRTIKEMIYKYLQSTNSKTIVNILPKIIDNYNNSYHTSIGMAPNEVTKENQHTVQLNLIKHANQKEREKLNVGDSVRHMVKQKSFAKGYRPKFSNQVYKIEKADGNYFYLGGLSRGYLPSELKKIDKVEKNPNPPDLQGTREGHLKELAQRPISEESIKESERLEKERRENPLALTRPKRNIKAPDRLKY